MSIIVRYACWPGHDAGATLPPDVDAPRAARRIVREWLHEDLSGEKLESAQLLVSELVTNAVVHGRGQVVLRAELDDDRLLVEVIDDGDGFERIVRHRDFDSGAGRTVLRLRLQSPALQRPACVAILLPPLGLRPFRWDAALLDDRLA